MSGVIEPMPESRERHARELVDDRERCQKLAERGDGGATVCGECGRATITDRTADDLRDGGGNPGELVSAARRVKQHDEAPHGTCAVAKCQPGDAEAAEISDAL